MTARWRALRAPTHGRHGARTSLVAQITPSAVVKLLGAVVGLQPGY